MKATVFVITLLIAGVLFAQPAATKNQAKAEAGDQTSGIDLQILLDRAKVSPGEIDGKIGTNVQKALVLFQEVKGLPITGKPDEATMKKLEEAAGRAPLYREYTITHQDTAGPFTGGIPSDFMEQAKLKRLNYTSALEALGEKFHTNPEILKDLNPSAQFTAGETIRVPNVSTSSSVTQAKQTGKPESKTQYVARIFGNQESPFIVVNQRSSTVLLKDPSGEILFYAPATVGSEMDPLPVGEWKVTVVKKNPVFMYNPELFWDADPNHSKAKLAPGPNNPVGLVWIGTSAPHYGLHGTPLPGKIGHSQSHGCVRMTNWDALRLAEMIKPGTKIIFE